MITINIYIYLVERDKENVYKVCSQPMKQL